MLGLELHLDGERMRLFDPASARHLRDLAEAKADLRPAMDDTALLGA